MKRREFVQSISLAAAGLVLGIENAGAADRFTPLYPSEPKPRSRGQRFLITGIEGTTIDVELAPEEIEEITINGSDLGAHDLSQFLRHTSRISGSFTMSEEAFKKLTVSVGDYVWIEGWFTYGSLAIS